jgi:hypothetical protein
MSNSQNPTDGVAEMPGAEEAGAAPASAVGLAPTTPADSVESAGGSQQVSVQDASSPGPTEAEKPGAKKRSKKPRAAESLADFIAMAYARKGQRVALKPKTQKLISKNPRLDGPEIDRLSDLARGDVTLAVARQLLLAILEVSNPLLKNSLREFVGGVLRAHPSFSPDEMQAALNNLPGGPNAGEALSAVVEADYSKNQALPEKLRRKKPELATLRSNAAYCLALWLAETRGTPAEELAGHLFDSLWRPDPKATRDDAARLRLLTEIRDPQAVGVACETFKLRADQMLRVADVARRAEAAALEQVSTLNASVERLKEEIRSIEEQVAAGERAMEEQRRRYEDALTHLRDDFEKLRSRVLRRIREDVGLLDQGLHALRRDPPKVHVMEDHAERAVARLRGEIKELEAED